MEVKARGRIPSWCSQACRQRAWEQRRAAESGRSAVEVVERVVQAHATPTRARPPRGDEWPALLRELAVQLDTGRIYPRDVPAINDALTDTVRALSRRAATHPRYRR